MQKSSKKQKISRFDLRILDIMVVSDCCQTTCLMFKVKKTLCVSCITGKMTAAPIPFQDKAAGRVVLSAPDARESDEVSAKPREIPFKRGKPAAGGPPEKGPPSDGRRLSGGLFWTFLYIFWQKSLRQLMLLF